MNRRQFITSLAAATLLAPLTGLAGNRQSIAGNGDYFSAWASSDGHYFISGFDADGRVKFETPLPGRGHALAIHPHGNHIIAVARRPETFLLVIDSQSGEILHKLESRSGRHFYGHSYFSADGNHLYTTENDFEHSRGVIGVRDVLADYQQIDEFSAHGIGPHELAMLSNGRTLVVANGGILTRPETGRSKLNLDTMSPSLTYLDAETGELMEQHKLPQSLHKNSIRHFSVNAKDQICFAMQYQGQYQSNDDEILPLVGFHQMGQDIKLLKAPATITKQMSNYCGSVCSDSSSRWFAVSSPKGNLITFWSASDGQFVGSTEVKDGCGIAAGTQNGEFLLSSGTGALSRYRIGSHKQQQLNRNSLDKRWDNHIAHL